MGKTITFLNKDVAEKALQEALGFDANAKLTQNEETFVVSFASCCGPNDGCSQGERDAIYQAVFNEFNYEMKWVKEDLNYLRERLNKHIDNGHLPPISDAGKMKGALKALGMSDSYQVQTPSVYVQY